MSTPEEAMANQSKERKGARAAEGKQAMSEYIAERNAERAKTARLKELRLAEEATDKAAETKQVTKKKEAPAVKSTAARAAGQE
jgi:hypothetical protein